MRKKKRGGRNGRNEEARPHLRLAKEYRKLLKEVGWTQIEASRRLHFAARSSRRYASGEAELPGSAMIVLRLLARGVLTERQISSALR